MPGPFPVVNLPVSCTNSQLPLCSSPGLCLRCKLTCTKSLQWPEFCRRELVCLFRTVELPHFPSFCTPSQACKELCWCLPASLPCRAEQALDRSPSCGHTDPSAVSHSVWQTLQPASAGKQRGKVLLLAEIKCL